jgi:hypothetical protein
MTNLMVKFDRNMVKFYDNIQQHHFCTMETFTSIYYDQTVQFLTFNEINRSILDKNTVKYKVEVEFNEERGIEIELILNANNVINELDIFYMIVQDARSTQSSQDDCQEFIECNLAAKKLKHLVGTELFDKYLNCQMNCII